MIVLKILLALIVLLVTVIMLIPVGADVGYEDGRLHVAAKAAGKLIVLYPRQKRPPKTEKKPKPPEKKKQEKPKEKKPKKKLALSFSKEDIFELVKKVLKGFGIFGRKLRVDRFHLNYIASGRDPYNVAVIFGYVNACLYALAPICAKRFDVKDLDVRTSADFTTEHMHLDLGIAMSIRIGAIVRMLFSIAFGALGILIKNKLRTRGEKRTDTAPQSDKQTDNNENIQQEERNDQNGE